MLNCQVALDKTASLSKCKLIKKNSMEASHKGVEYELEGESIITAF